MLDHPPIIIKLPGHIFSDASQSLRDDINTWLDICGIKDDEVTSCYLKEEAEGFATPPSSNSLTHIAFQFENGKAAALFKLRFG